MYDDLLRIELPGNIRSVSSTTLIVFGDKVAVLATGRTTTLLEEAMNHALAVVAGWISERSPKLSISKTKTIILTTKCGHQLPRFLLDGTLLQLKENMRYLSVVLSTQQEYRKHLKVAVEKAVKTVASLCRLMPNIEGPRQRKSNF